jgi:hypothetical protein
VTTCGWLTSSRESLRSVEIGSVSDLCPVRVQFVSGLCLVCVWIVSGLCLVQRFSPFQHCGGWGSGAFGHRE